MSYVSIEIHVAQFVPTSVVIVTLPFGRRHANCILMKLQK